MPTAVKNNVDLIRLSVRQSLGIELDCFTTPGGGVKFSESILKRCSEVCAYYLGTDSDALNAFLSPTLVNDATLSDVLAMGETFSRAEEAKKFEVGPSEYKFIQASTILLRRRITLDSAVGVWSHVTGSSAEEAEKQIREGVSAGYISLQGLDNEKYSPIVRFVGTPRLSHLVNYISRANPPGGAEVLSATMSTMIELGTLKVSG